jgi:hypothetical protein
MANEKAVTFYGRLSFPTFTADAAYQRNLKGSYPTPDVASTSPDFSLLVTEAQWLKVKKHITEVFLPYCVEQHKKGEKRDALTPAEAKDIADGLDDLENQRYNSPAKAVSEKSAILAPEAVASIKVIGPKGSDFELKAIVRSEAELKVPDPDILTFPVIVPINASTHELYAGCVATVTGNLYAYHAGPKNPGVAMGGAIVVFRDDADRFGGGVAMDADEMFLD